MHMCILDTGGEIEGKGLVGMLEIYSWGHRMHTCILDGGEPKKSSQTPPKTIQNLLKSIQIHQKSIKIDPKTNKNPSKMHQNPS